MDSLFPLWSFLFIYLSLSLFPYCISNTSSSFLLLLLHNHSFVLRSNPFHIRPRSLNLSQRQITTMSSRRPRQSEGTSRITDDQIIDLVSKLQQLLPEIRNRRSNKVSASKVLQETCNHIRNLHKEVDDLSDRLSQLLATIESDSAEAAIIRSLIM